MYDNYEKVARKRVKKKKGFYYHLATFVIINAFIYISAGMHSGFSIFNGPAVPWGVGLAFHYLAVFGIPGSGVLSKDWEEREYEKEMEKLSHRNLPPGGPELESDYENSTPEKQKQKNWDDKDLV